MTNEFQLGETVVNSQTLKIGRVGDTTDEGDDSHAQIIYEDGSTGWVHHSAVKKLLLEVDPPKPDPNQGTFGFLSD